MSNNNLVERLKIAQMLMSTRDGQGNHIVSPKWVIDNYFNTKGDYRKSKIKKILDGR